MSSMDEVYHLMKDDTEAVSVISDEASEIQQFYAGQTVLLTGATGFLGKCLVEKLLRSCPDLKRIYILVRPTQKLSVEDKLKQYFENEIFDQLRKTMPNFAEKLTAVKGDLMEDKLGLSNEDRQILKNEVDIMFHTAATRKFDEKISIALKTNVLATTEMLELAQECKHLKVFMYMSTAYSHCHQKVIEEKFYRSPADLKMIKDILAADSENEFGVTDEALSMLLGEWPNVYTFTKATAEELVRQYGNKATFPCGVYRPSIVIGTYKEPIAGWSSSTSGPVLPIIGATLGMLHASFLRELPMDLIPADMTTNAFLATTWDTVNRWNDDRHALVYNFGSSTVNPTSFPRLCELLHQAGLKAPPLNTVWYPFFVHLNNFWAFFLLHLLLHGIPALIADIFLLLQGKRPMALGLFVKFTKNMDKLVYFGNGNWRIHIVETLAVYDRLNDTDKKLFFFDIRSFDWADYAPGYYRGIRLYLLKDPLDTAIEGRKKYQKLFFIHYGVMTVLFLIVAYFLMKLLSPAPKISI